VKRALLLNADYVPLHFVTDIDAFVLVYKGIAEIIEIDGHQSTWVDENLTSPGRVWPCPATIRLLTRVNKHWKSPRFRKKVLFNRDHWECQYCHKKLSLNTVTIDHVHPKSRGGKTTWKNCVTSCRACNKKKANRTPIEASMPLDRPPTEPNQLHFWNVAKGNDWHIDWELFVGQRDS
jgi:hypothetical protein